LVDLVLLLRLRYNCMVRVTVSFKRPARDDLCEFMQSLHCWNLQNIGLSCSCRYSKT